MNLITTENQVENKKKEKEEELKNKTNNYTFICPALNEAVQNGLVSFHPTFISPHIISPHVISPHVHFTPGSFHPTFISPHVRFTPHLNYKMRLRLMTIATQF